MQIKKETGKPKPMNAIFSVLPIILLCLNSAVFGQLNSWEEYIKAGDTAIAKARFADAESAYREALRLSEEFKEKDPRRAVTFIKLAECLNAQSKREEAEILAQRSLSALDQAIRGSKSKDQAGEYYKTETTITILNQAAGIFVANRKYAEAESAYKRAIAIREDGARTIELPRSNEDYLRFMAQQLTQASMKLIDAYDRLAKLYFVQKRFGEAERLYSKSMKILEAEYKVEKPPVAIGLSNLAVVYAAQGKYDKAEGLFARAINIYEQSDWLDKPAVAATFENYSLLLKKIGRQAEASVMFERAREIRARLH
jgi:tetratricopeptide (TPR) repeat protein